MMPVYCIMIIMSSCATVLYVYSLSFWKPGNNSGIGHDRISHMDQIKTVAFSPDSKHAVTGGVDCSLILWTADEAKMEQVLRINNFLLDKQIGFK